MNDEAPWLRVVKGDPSDEELAAALAVLTAVLTARTSGPPAPEPRTSGWSAYWRSVRAPLVPGPGAWQSSARPG